MDDGSHLPLEEGHVKKKSGIFDKLTHIFHGKQQEAVTENCFSVFRPFWTVF